MNSSDPETATFVLHKATKIKCCLFLQKAQLSLGKMRYSLYSSCCTPDH